MGSMAAGISRPLLASASQTARGVDLNLDEFNLSAPVKRPMEALGGSWISESNVALGDAFWANLDSGSDVFTEGDKDLLKKLFNASLSDRRMEGNRFTAPDASFSHVEKLRSLVKEEEVVQQLRKEIFLSSKFVKEAPGPMFPSSWTDSIEIAKEKKQAHSMFHSVDFKNHSTVLEQALKSTEPAFEKSTEEGTKFRVYTFGCMEVRTTQENGRKEIIGSVFSIRAHSKAGISQTDSEDKLVKVTEYVENAAQSRRSFVVLKTESGSSIVIEKLMDGTVTWQDNSTDLEDRISLAKVVRSDDCRIGVTVGDMMAYQINNMESGSSQSKCKQFASGAYNLACGNNDANSGFRSCGWGEGWQLWIAGFNKHMRLQAAR